MRAATLQTAYSRADEPRPATSTLRPTSRGKIVGDDAKIRHVLATIDRVARSSCTVLVTGESGTGKELVVAALHDASTRRDGPLVTINCGAIPTELIESELFGHAKGAFTGAQEKRRGLVAAAEGGTLFLDEVGELPAAAQVKLLRVLQSREYTPVGETKPVKCDVRIVGATHRDLEKDVATGRFREDLYYRLNVINIHLPALRERGTDIRVLAHHFFRCAVEDSARGDLRGISESALRVIENHNWPGNVRALENAIQRGVLLSRGPYVEVDDILGAGFRGPALEMRSLTRPDPRRDSMPVSEAVTGAFRRLSSRPKGAPVTIPPPPVPPVTVSAPAPEAQVIPLQRTASNPQFPRVLPDRGVDLFSAVEQYQNNLIRQALARTGGNKNRAAQLLGVNRTTLVEMIRRRGLA